jgi:hypothetical protein
MIRFVLPLVCAAGLQAPQPTGEERKPRPALPPAIRPVVELARAAPAEFFADTITRLVEGGKIAPKELEIELLQDAFTAAANAQEPIRLIAMPATPPDTRALYRGKAGELRLDALSLETGVVRAMLGVDRAKARELFERVPRPVLEPRPCEDPLVADTSAYYGIVGVMAQSAFTAAEQEKEEHVRFLLTVLAGIRSPNELAAFIRAIGSIRWTAAEWELLLGALTAKLETTAPDYRPFAISIEGLRADLERISQIAQSQGLGTDVLARGFRKYLVTQLTAPRCDEDFGGALQAITWFNQSFRGALPAITEEEGRPLKRTGGFKAELYFQSEDSKRIGDALTRLRYVPGEGPRSEAERSTGEWRNMFADFLRDLDAWRPSGSEIDFFHQKATVLQSLFQLAPPGEDRDRLIEVCVAFLQSSGAERQNPAEWLMQLKGIVEQAGSDAPKLMEAFRASSNPAVALYGTVGLARR